MNRRRSISLVLVLVICAALELLLHRAGLHRLLPTAESARLLQAVDFLARLSLHMTGLLALVLCTWGVVEFVRDCGQLCRYGRAALLMGGTLFLPLAAVALWMQLPASIAPHLNTTFCLLLLVLLLAGARRPAPLRVKLGILYLTLPLLLHGYALAAPLLPGLLPSRLHATPAHAQMLANHLFVAAGFVTLLLFTAFPRMLALSTMAPVVVAAATSATFGILASRHYGAVARVLFDSFYLSLPAARETAGQTVTLCAAALFCFSLCVATLIRSGGIARGMAFGLLLVALAGLHLGRSHQMLLALAGLLQLVRGALMLGGQRRDLATPAPAAEHWRTYLNRLAKACDDDGAPPPDAVVLRHDGKQIARVCGTNDGVAYAVRLLFRVSSGRLEQLEIDVGQPPNDKAPASLFRRHGRRGGRLADGSGPRVPTFDPQFVVRDATDSVAPVLAAERFELGLLAHGWLGCWPAEGARYLSRPAEDGWPVPVAEIDRDAADAPLHDLAQLLRLVVRISRRLGTR